MSNAKHRVRSSRVRYRDWLALQGTLVQRVASELEQMSELIGEQTTEPRLWIENYAKLWAGLIGDVGDWVKKEAGEPLRPTAEWVSRCREKLSPGQKTRFRIEVPIEAFQAEEGKPRPQITVITAGLSRAGSVEGITLKPGVHLSFKNPVVKRSDRFVDLNLHDLPELHTGEIYGGLVWANETKQPVAAIELLIV